MNIVKWFVFHCWGLLFQFLSCCYNKIQIQFKGERSHSDSISRVEYVLVEKPMLQQRKETFWCLAIYIPGTKEEQNAECGIKSKYPHPATHFLYGGFTSYSPHNLHKQMGTKCLNIWASGGGSISYPTHCCHIFNLY